MNQKRKRTNTKVTSALLNKIIGYSLLMLMGIGMYGFSTVYLRHQSAQTANEIKKIERSISLEKRKYAELGTELARLTTRDSLKSMNEIYTLDLHMPKDRQIVRVTENVEARLYRKTQNSLLTASSF